MARVLRALLVLGAFLLPACGGSRDPSRVPARLQTVVLEADRDATLYGDSPGGLANGSGQHFFTGTTSGSAIRRSLVRFDVAGAIPPGAMVVSVRLTLSCSRQQGGGHLVTLHRALADWGEGASDAPDPEGSGTTSLSGDATWLHRFYDAQFWTTPGGDFHAAVAGSTQAVVTGDNEFASTPEMVGDVQGWVDAPAFNFGWLLRGDEGSSGSAKRFDSSENPQAALRPRLRVDYTSP